MRITAAIFFIGALSGAAHAQIVNPGGGGAGTNVTIVNPVDGGLNVKVNCVVGCAGGTFNNNADGVATSATNGQSAAWLYAYNGTTWDRLRDDASKFLYVNIGAGSIANTGFNALQGGAANAAGNPFYVAPGTGASFTTTPKAGTFTSGACIVAISVTSCAVAGTYNHVLVQNLPTNANNVACAWAATPSLTSGNAVLLTPGMSISWGQPYSALPGAQALNCISATGSSNVYVETN